MGDRFAVVMAARPALAAAEYDSDALVQLAEGKWIRTEGRSRV